MKRTHKINTTGIIKYHDFYNESGKLIAYCSIINPDTITYLCHVNYFGIINKYGNHEINYSIR